MGVKNVRIVWEDERQKLAGWNAGKPMPEDVLMPKPWACALCHLAPPDVARSRKARSVRPVRARGWRAGWRGALWGSIALPLALWPPRARVPPMFAVYARERYRRNPRAIAGIPPQDV